MLETSDGYPCPQVRRPRGPSKFQADLTPPHCYKVAERVVHQPLMAYLETNNTLSGCQFGFRHGRYTEMTLASVSETIVRGIDNRKLSLLCLLDLSKAFDCVPHRELLDKLSQLGITDSWFHSYLENRTQSVKIGRILSEPRSVSCGVPQGSILGPLLFLIDVNDIPRVIKQSSPGTEVAVYADDTQAVRQCEPPRLQTMVQ